MDIAGGQCDISNAKLDEVHCNHWCYSTPNCKAYVTGGAGTCWLKSCDTPVAAASDRHGYTLTGPHPQPPAPAGNATSPLEQLSVEVLPTRSVRATTNPPPPYTHACVLTEGINLTPPLSRQHDLRVPAPGRTSPHRDLPLYHVHRRLRAPLAPRLLRPARRGGTRRRAALRAAVPGRVGGARAQPRGAAARLEGVGDGRRPRAACGGGGRVCGWVGSRRLAGYRRCHDRLRERRRGAARRPDRRLRTEGPRQQGRPLQHRLGVSAHGRRRGRRQRRPRRRKRERVTPVLPLQWCAADHSRHAQAACWLRRPRRPRHHQGPRGGVQYGLAHGASCRDTAVLWLWRRDTTCLWPICVHTARAHR